MLKVFKLPYVIVLLIVASQIIFAARENTRPSSISYLHPRPSSQLNSNQSTILLRLHAAAGIAKADIWFNVFGSQSGDCPGDILFSDDQKTIIFRPQQYFHPGENVSVTIYDKNQELFSYDFAVSPMTESEKKLIRDEFPSIDQSIKKTNYTPSLGKVTTINGVTVPSDFPQFTIQEADPDNTAPGSLFFGLRGSYFMILKNDGTPLFYEKSNDFLMDFKVQPNGMLSRLVDNWDSGERFYAIMDHQFTYTDSFQVQGGYETDHHDFQLLPNGHALLIAGDYQYIDMSEIVPGGDPNARVRGCHVQELDQNKNVVFQWTCWDDIPITDTENKNLQAANIDYLHMNSVALDFDGHIIASCRNSSQCIKINRNTGELMWVLGGKQSSFYFINDPDQNSYQHHFRAVPNKPHQYTMFDNGNTKSPHYSRAVEFKLDTTKLIAERVWEFRPQSDYKVNWLGSVQRLPNGNSLINWSGGGLPFATEVTPDGEVVYQARHKKKLPCYRTFRFDWQGVAAKPRLFVEAEDNRVVLIFNKFGDKNVKLYKIYHGLSPNNLSFRAASMGTRFDVENLENYRRHYFQVVAVDKADRESEASDVKSINVKYIEENVNVLQNGDFSNGRENWQFREEDGASADALISNGEFEIQITDGGVHYDYVSLFQNGVPVYKDKTYLFEFDAYAASPRAIEAKVANTNELYNYGRIGFTALTTNKKKFSYIFKMMEHTDLDAKVVFNCGGSDASVTLDNVSLKVISETEITAPEQNAVEEFVLLRNYPNPFNASTRISYTLPTKSRVELTIYNVRGERVARLKNELQEKGEHTVIWNGANDLAVDVSSGLYFCRLKTTNSVRAIKLLIAR